MVIYKKRKIVSKAINIGLNYVTCIFVDIPKISIVKNAVLRLRVQNNPRGVLRN
jgi:hypothetical protein